MSIRIMSAVWDNSAQSGGNLLLLLALADFANDEGECWPAVATLARKARMTERHVRRVLHELQESGEVEVMPEAGQHGTNRYLVRPKTGGTDKMSPLTFQAVPPDVGVLPPLTPASAKPSLEPSIESPAGSRSELELEAERFVEWFLRLLKDTGAPEPRVTPGIRSAWADAYAKLRRIDGRSKEDIAAVCRWARRDNFWSRNFLSPAKLRQKNQAQVFYYDVFANQIHHGNTTGRPNGRGFEGSNLGQYAELDGHMATGT